MKQLISLKKYHAVVIEMVIKSFNSQNINLEVHEGDYVAIMGPSGW